MLGALRCQSEPYLCRLEAKVVSCSKILPSKYEVQFDDTILFPEGGGQPGDMGSIVLNNSTDLVVEDTQRKGLKAVHYVNGEIEPGSKVTLNLDWARRFDHMQQHTGQHLLSAVLNEKYELKTLSWSMSADKTSPNYIELARKLTDEEVEDTQTAVSDWIAKAVEISVTTTSELNPEKGYLRFINIAGLNDNNACCGTHLTSTSQIGSILLLHQQQIRGSNSRLYFYVGDRAVAASRQAQSQLRALGATLSAPPAGVTDKVNSLMDQMKALKTYVKETDAVLAGHDAEYLRKNEGGLLVKENYTGEYLRLVVKELSKDKYELPRPSILVAVTWENGSKKTKDSKANGANGANGAVTILGSTAEQVAGAVTTVKDCVPSIKGGGKGTTWQGKLTNVDDGDINKLTAALN